MENTENPDKKMLHMKRCLFNNTNLTAQRTLFGFFAIKSDHPFSFFPTETGVRN